MACDNLTVPRKTLTLRAARARGPPAGFLTVTKVLGCRALNRPADPLPGGAAKPGGEGDGRGRGAGGLPSAFGPGSPLTSHPGPCLLRGSRCDKAHRVGELQAAELHCRSSGTEVWDRGVGRAAPCGRSEGDSAAGLCPQLLSDRHCSLCHRPACASVSKLPL